MTLLDSEWQRLFALLDHGWPGDLTPDAADAYRALLDGVDVERIVAGVRRLLHQGHKWRPTAAEILGAALRDPSVPTFDEASQLIYGRDGVLDAGRRRNGEPPMTYVSEADRRRQINERRVARAAGMHSLVGSFVRRVGLDRLERIPLHDPEWGPKHRNDLKASWVEHVDAMQGREVAALAAGTGPEGLKQLDPLAALGLAGPRGELAMSTAPDRFQRSGASTTTHEGEMTS